MYAQRKNCSELTALLLKISDITIDLCCKIVIMEIVCSYYLWMKKQVIVSPSLLGYQIFDMMEGTGINLSLPRKHVLHYLMAVFSTIFDL